MARRAFSQALRLKGGVPYAIGACRLLRVCVSCARTKLSAERVAVAVLSAPSVSLCASGSDGEDFLSRLKKKINEQAKNVKKPEVSVPDKEEAVLTFSGYVRASHIC
jgi:hypothetical protein